MSFSVTQIPAVAEVSLESLHVTSWHLSKGSSVLTLAYKAGSSPPSPLWTHLPPLSLFLMPLQPHRPPVSWVCSAHFCLWTFAPPLPLPEWSPFMCPHSFFSNTLARGKAWGIPSPSFKIAILPHSVSPHWIPHLRSFHVLYIYHSFDYGLSPLPGTSIPQEQGSSCVVLCCFPYT